MSKRPAWTEREATAQSLDIEFSRSQITKLRKILNSGQQKSTKTKAASVASSSRTRAAAKA